MLPLLALVAAGCAPAIVQAMREMKARWKRAALGVFAGLGIIHSGVCLVSAGPDVICYTNEFWGGTREGYKYLSDSNYDWGQGLKELLDWREANHVDVVDVWYFGLDPRARVLPLRLLPLGDPGFVQGRPWEEGIFRGKCVAVSTTVLYGPYLDSHDSGAVEFLKLRKPMDRTTTYFIYDFRESPPGSP